jgi:hypothetical protein
MDKNVEAASRQTKKEIGDVKKGTRDIKKEVKDMKDNLSKGEQRRGRSQSHDDSSVRKV